MDIHKVICELERGTRRIDDEYQSYCKPYGYMYDVVAYRMGDNIRIDLKKKS